MNTSYLLGSTKTTSKFNLLDCHDTVILPKMYVWQKDWDNAVVWMTSHNITVLQLDLTVNCVHNFNALFNLWYAFYFAISCLLMFVLCVYTFHGLKIVLTLTFTLRVDIDTSCMNAAWLSTWNQCSISFQKWFLSTSGLKIQKWEPAIGYI